MKGLTRHSQIILYVADMGRSVEFYQDHLGLVVSFPAAGIEDLAAQHWVTFDAGGMTIALHAGGNGNLGPEAPAITLFVEDVATAHRELEAKGLHVSAIENPHPGVITFHLSDPDNLFIHIQER